MKRPLTAYLLTGTLMLTALTPALAQTNAPIQAQQQPVAPETNPPGDIPDTQAFVTYRSPQGFRLDVPEGWARSSTEQGAHFADKYGSVDVQAKTAENAPTVSSAQQTQVAALMATNQAVEVSQVQDVQLPSGQAVRIDYASNSEPNPVTNKQIRLENTEYLYYQNGELVAVTFSAPYGADNVDQWRYMSESFDWN